MKEINVELITNPSSERAILSSCLKSEDLIIQLESDGITPEYFGIPSNKYIMMAIYYLASKNIKPSPLAIKEVLTDSNAKNELGKMGGLDYLTMLEDAPIDLNNVGIFIEKVKQAHARRSIIDACDKTIDLMCSTSAETMNPIELLSSIEERIGNIQIDSTSKTEVYKMGDDTDEVLAQRESTPEAVPGLEVGWSYFDKVTNGAIPGDLIVVVAESKTGKSVTLTNWATNLSIIDKVPILYFDTEMSAREQEDRILSRLSQVPHNEIVSGMYVLDTENGIASDKIERVNKAKEMLKQGEYYHIYLPHFDIKQITHIAKQYKLKYNIQAIFFDYIKIPSSGDGLNKNTAEYQALGFFASGLKDLAGTLGVPVFSAAQTNRAKLGDVEKDASSIGGSYRILQLASKLMFLTNKSDEQIAKQGIQNGNQILSIKYQRNGQSDVPPIDIMFHRELLYQEEV